MCVFIFFVRMCVCVFVGVSSYFVGNCVSVCSHLCKSASVCVSYVGIHDCVHMCLCVYVSVCVSVCVCVCVYVCRESRAVKVEGVFLCLRI